MCSMGFSGLWNAFMIWGMKLFKRVSPISSLAHYWSYRFGLSPDYSKWVGARKNETDKKVVDEKEV